MKGKFFAVLVVLVLAAALLSGCADSGKGDITDNGDLTDRVASADGRIVGSQGDEVKQENTTETGVSDDKSAGQVDTPAQTQEKSSESLSSGRADISPGESGDSPDNNSGEAVNSPPAVLPVEPDNGSDPNDFAAVKYVDPPILLSAKLIGSGIDSKFSLSIILPESLFDFEGSYHGSAEATLEISYRDVGGSWVDWEEQTFELWRIDRTTQALSFLYPAVNMILRTEFRVRLKYHYIVDSGDEYTIRSEWSATADSMPDGPKLDGSEAFVGQWHKMNMLAAGWDERYAFHPDGTYIYATSQINRDTTIIFIFGTWSVYNSGLAMYADRILSVEGAKIIHDDNLGDRLEGGEPVLTVIDLPERAMCLIERGDPDTLTGRRTIWINGEPWYNFDENDEYSSFFDEYSYFMGE